MLRVKLMKKADYSENRVDVVCEENFSRLLGGAWVEEVPPFRDKESLKFIEEIDKGTLVDGDWYSYCSPYGRTCMCHLCSGTKYALICIANSREGIYTAYKNYGKDIWERLAELELDILIAYNIWDDDFGINSMPCEFPTCIIENYLLNGSEQEVIYDGLPKGEGSYMDEQGRFHVSRYDIEQYRYNWKEDLPNILQSLRQKLKSNCLLWDITPTEIPIREIYERCQNFPYSDEDGVPRRILLAMSECPAYSLFKCPHILYIRLDQDGNYSFEDHYSVKWPNFYEIIGDVIKPFDSQCQEAVTAVFDVENFYREDDFLEDILWVFHDNGQELTCYSGELGLKKLIDFWETAMPRTSQCSDATCKSEVQE